MCVFVCISVNRLEPVKVVLISSTDRALFWALDEMHTKLKCFNSVLYSVALMHRTLAWHSNQIKCFARQYVRFYCIGWRKVIRWKLMLPYALAYSLSPSLSHTISLNLADTSFTFIGSSLYASVITMHAFGNKKKITVTFKVN